MATLDVLVVDDNSINGRVYERIVCRLDGYRCRWFDDPREALAWSAENPSALAIVDYAMPGTNGIEFVKAFRRIPGRAAVPIIMLTAMNSSSLRDEASDVGVDTFFAKPINPERFLNEARRLIERYELTKART